MVIFLNIRIKKPVTARIKDPHGLSVENEWAKKIYPISVYSCASVISSPLIRNIFFDPVKVVRLP